MSRCIENLCSAQDSLSADVVVAALDAFPANQVDTPPENDRNLVFHIDQIEQVRARIR